MHLWFIVLSFFLGWNAQAALSLNEVLESAERAYPTILGAQRDLQKAEMDQLSARGGFDPNFKTSFYTILDGYYNYSASDLVLEQPTSLWGTKFYTGYRNGQGTFPIYESRLGTMSGGEIRGGIEVPILKGGSIDERRAKLKSSEQGIHVASEGLSVQVLEVRRQAAYKFWDWLAYGKKKAVAEELLEIARVRDQALAHRVHHGDTAQIDRVDNQRLLVQRQSGLLSAERAFQKAGFELSLYYRDSAGNPIIPDISVLPSNFPEERVLPDHSILENVDLSSHPELKRLDSQSRQLQVDYDLAKNQILPKLDFQLSISQDFGVNTGNPYVTPTAYPREVKAAFYLEFPLFFRTSRGKFQAAALSLDKLNFTQQLTQDRLKMQLRDSIQAMQAAHTRITWAQEEIGLSRKLENAERLRFEHGDSNLINVNIREQVTRDAYGREIDALADFFKAKADYEVARGQISRNN